MPAVGSVVGLAVLAAALLIFYLVHRRAERRADRRLDELEELVHGQDQITGVLRRHLAPGLAVGQPRRVVSNGHLKVVRDLRAWIGTAVSAVGLTALWRRRESLALVALGGVAGVTLGSVVADPPSNEAVPLPGPTVTVTRTATATVTVTARRTVTVTPRPVSATRSRPGQTVVPVGGGDEPPVGEIEGDEPTPTLPPDTTPPPDVTTPPDDSDDGDEDEVRPPRRRCLVDVDLRPLAGAKLLCRR